MMSAELKSHSEEDLGDQNDSNRYKLSISRKDSHIVSVPYPILCTVFTEAAGLVASGVDIYPMPGEQRKYNITNKGGVPYVVTVNPSNSIVCDKQCSRFNAFRLCGHCLALAEHLKVLDKFLGVCRSKKLAANFGQNG